MACEFPIVVWQSFCELQYTYFTLLFKKYTLLLASNDISKHDLISLDNIAMIGKQNRLKKRRKVHVNQSNEKIVHEAIASSDIAYAYIEQHFRLL